MKIIHDAKELQKTTLALRAQGKTIALVPTMGNLHAGHASLIDLARLHADILIVSVFVNPTQFGPNEDYEKYPRTLAADQKICETHNVDILFAPSPAIIYAPTFSTYISETSCSLGLCGRTRPTHFRGVCTIVNILFNLTQPNIAIFGQKDAQQVAVLKRMVQDLHIPIKILVAPIIREQDGLALSSRNQYLTKKEREIAPQIQETLQTLTSMISAGTQSTQTLTELFIKTLHANPIFKVDYIEIVDISTMHAINKVVLGSTLIAVAVRMTDSKTRLIDNVIV